MVQALAKHIEQLVALPDALRETTIRRFKKLCDSCGCHNERELAAAGLLEPKRGRAAVGGHHLGLLTAEHHHDDYFARNPHQPYCQYVVAPKLAKFRAKVADRSTGRA
jgi:hypothetical protein